jgi:hypothetical protein
MAFSNYQDFRTGVQILIEGDDLSNNFSVNTLDMIINLAEARVVHGDNMSPGLRASSMLVPLSQAVTSNSAALPADLLELKEVRFAGRPALDIVPLDRLHDLIYPQTGGGNSAYAAQDGDTLTFWPTASGTVIGSYYALPESLEGGLHATFLRYPQLYVYASLYEAALFLGMDAKTPIWEARYRQLADGANHSERMRVYGGGPLKMRTR